MTSLDDLDETIELHHAALGLFVTGDPEPLKALYSRADDVTLANPFGAPRLRMGGRGPHHGACSPTLRGRGCRGL